MANYRGCVNWKEAKVALARQASVRGQKNAATGCPAAPKADQAGPSAEQGNLSMGGTTMSEKGALLRPPLSEP
jgi:hypothetical protein